MCLSIYQLPIVFYIFLSSYPTVIKYSAHATYCKQYLKASCSLDARCCASFTLTSNFMRDNKAATHRLSLL